MRSATKTKSVDVAASSSTNSFDRSKRRLAWLLLLPTLFVVAVVALYPLGLTIYESFTNARLGSTTPSEWVGLQNYRDLLSDRSFGRAIINTLLFSALTVTIEFLLGLGIALVINSNFKGRGVLRAVMLVPWAIPTVVAAQMWQWIYNDNYGFLNDLLVNKLGLLDRGIVWTGRSTALYAVAAVDIWKTTPFMALLLLAGLQVIPPDIYEAARVDGANALQQFWKLTLPLLKPAILVALIFRTLDALRVFDVFYVFFGDRADTTTMASYAQRNLVNFSDLGYGSAISVAIFFIIAIVVVIYVTAFKVEEA